MFYLKLKGLVPCAIAACSTIYSCTNNDDLTVNNEQENQQAKTEISSKQFVDENLSEFATILSKLVASNKDVRAFLKTESLKEFDKNTDVLYYLVRDEQIGDKTFRDLLVEASSEEQISKIEKNVPLLNIYNVRVDPLGVYPENMDVEDNEIPVAVSMPDSTYLYFNGVKDCGLAKGDVPGFNLFVVGLNSRVDAKSITMDNDNCVRNKGNQQRATIKTVMFKSPNFDGREPNRSLRKSIAPPVNVFGNYAPAAYYFFNDEGNGINQKAFQRDYIYYGIRPDKPQGKLNGSISEYLAYIEINPNTYFTISDDKSENGDAYLLKYEHTQTSSSLTEDRLIDIFWSKGVYNFRFDIIKSTQNSSTTVYVPLKPCDIWDFHIEYEKTEATRWKHSKHTYKINPRKFTPKPVYYSNAIDLGKWDISKEALTRMIIISEEDREQETTVTYTYDVCKAKERNFSGNQKVNMGLSISEIINTFNLEQYISASANNTTTTTEKISVTTHTKTGSDPLGSVEVYFFDPIITSRNGNNYIMKTYNCGSVSFGIVAK